MSHEVGLTVAWIDEQIVVSGECDMNTAPLLLNTIDQHLAGRDRIRINCERLTFCDSSCLACFLAVIRNGKHIVLVKPHSAVRRALELLINWDIEGFEVED